MFLFALALGSALWAQTNGGLSNEAKLKAQLENVHKEIEQIREQLIISEMQARGYQAVYQEDGNIQFVGMSQGTVSVEL